MEPEIESLIPDNWEPTGRSEYDIHGQTGRLIVDIRQKGSAPKYLLEPVLDFTPVYGESSWGMRREDVWPGLFPRDVAVPIQWYAMRRIK